MNNNDENKQSLPNNILSDYGERDQKDLEKEREGLSLPDNILDNYGEKDQKDSEKEQEVESLPENILDNYGEKDQKDLEKERESLSLPDNILDNYDEKKEFDESAQTLPNIILDDDAIKQKLVRKILDKQKQISVQTKEINELKKQRESKGVLDEK